MPRELHKQNKVKQVLRGLRRMYGRRTFVREGTGLDTLVEAMLSQNTNMANASRGFKQLRRQFPTWNKVLAAPVRDVQRCIAICGLARMRARRLQDLLARIRAERGRLNIDFLGDLETAEAYAWLTRFHGIGPKTAAFTLLFAFEHPTLPVDNGVLRVLRRTKLVRAKARDAEAERVMSPLIPRGGHYEMHVLLFTHAKQRCRPKNPKCDECELLTLCPFGNRRVRKLPPKTIEPFVAIRRRPASLARFASAGISKSSADEPAFKPRSGARM
jgi:endonuclease-3